MRLRRLLGAGAAALAAVAVSAAPASAADGRILQVHPKGSAVEILFAGNGLAPGTAIDPTSVDVAFNGTHLLATAAPAETASRDLRRGALLVIDTSGSMRGAGLAGAKAAAGAFLQSVPADVEVGLVTFSQRPHLLAAPTTDRSALLAQIARLSVSGQTALYDATSLALGQLNAYASKTVVLLTDGNDTRSVTSLRSIVGQIKKSKTIVDAVGFRTNAGQSAPLQAMASASGGRVIAASAATALADAFRQAARDISSQVVITATIPAQLAGQSGTIAVTAQAGAHPLSDSAYVSLPGGATAPTAQPAAIGPKPLTVSTSGIRSHAALFLGLGLVFLALLVLIVFALGSFTPGREEKVARRLSIYTLTGRRKPKEHETTAFGESTVARSAVELAGRAIAKRDFEAALAAQLEASAVPLKPAEWLLIQTGAMLGTALFLFLLTGGKLVPTLLGLVFGVAGPLGFLKIKESRRRSAFLAGLPDTLQLIAGSLSAGYSLPQAVDTVVTEGTEPIAGEFNRALIETRLGVPIEDALDSVAVRTRSRDFAWVVMAIRIQREVGGNLAEVLKTTADTLRERERLRRQVQVLSAEGRLSAWILGGLPVVFALYLITVRPEYIKVLVTDKIGIIMLVGAVIEMVVGSLWLRKVVRVEV